MYFVWTIKKCLFNLLKYFNLKSNSLIHSYSVSHFSWFSVLKCQKCFQKFLDNVILWKLSRWWVFQTFHEYTSAELQYTCLTSENRWKIWPENTSVFQLVPPFYNFLFPYAIRPPWLWQNASCCMLDLWKAGQQDEIWQ